MKKQTFLFTNFILATCLSLAGLTLSVNAQAADIGKQFYVGLNLVQVSYTEAKELKPSDSQESSSTGTLLTIGKELNEKLSLELGIKDYGETKITRTFDNFAFDLATRTFVPDGTRSFTSTISITSTLLGVKYNFSNQEKFNFYGKAGLESWKAELESSGGETLDSEDGSSLAVAVGMDFPTSVGVFQAELAPQRFKFEGADEDFVSSNFTIGYHYKF